MFRKTHNKLLDNRTTFEMRMASRVLLAIIGDEVSQWLALRHRSGVGIRRGIEIVQFSVRAALDA
jgi:hypothetical protein